MIKREIGGLRPLEYRVLKIRREQGEGQQTPPILSCGGTAAYRQVPGVQIDHGVGTLERADQHRVLGVATNGRRLDFRPPAAIADANRGDEPKAFGIGRIILEPFTASEGTVRLNAPACEARRFG